VVSCSALEYRYRDLLRQAYPEAWFRHLEVDRDLVSRRVAGRSDQGSLSVSELSQRLRAFSADVEQHQLQYFTSRRKR